MATGADAVCATLERHGVTHVFGLPGTQSIDLWEALRRRGAPRPIVATNELASSFMANGYARASGRVGVVVTIPGPGFTYALTGLAEALLDSVPLVHVAGAPMLRADGGFALQAIPQADTARPLVKKVIEVSSAAAVERAIEEALALAAAGEPGPVLVQLPESVLRSGVKRGDARRDTAPETTAPAHADLDAAVEQLGSARRPLLLCGQGAAGCSAAVRRVAELLPAPVLTTTSGRGIVPETHPCSLPFDSPGASATVVNELIAASDAILALGAKLSHNGSLGFALRLPAERLIRVDASADVLARGYPAALAVELDAAAFVERLRSRIARGGASDWTEAEIAGWRRRLAGSAATEEPRLAGRPPAELLAALRRAFPDETVVTTDSGLHQYLVRRHLTVAAPRTLLVPADFQSMGFGIPAAIGAAVATGGPAVAVVGDGGFAISGLELATAARAGIPLVAIVLVDRSFGLIRLQQLRRTGHESGVALPPLGLGHVAAAVGADHYALDHENLDDVLARAAASPRVSIVEVEVDQGRGSGRARARGLALASARSLLGDGAVARATELARHRRRSGPAGAS